MNLRNILGYSLCTIITSFLLWSCKPTEHNYKLAYELAQQRDSEGLDANTYKLMKEASLPPYRHIGNDSIRLLMKSMILQYVPDQDLSNTEFALKRYALAVGKYKALTNAKAHSDLLSHGGWHSYVLRTGEPEYYVMATQYDVLDSLPAQRKKFLQQYPGGCVGLPEPLAVMITRTK